MLNTINRRAALSLLATIFLWPALAANPAPPAARATPAEAQAHLQKAIAHYRKVGAKKAFDDFRTNPGPFVDRDLYVVVVALDGLCVAHINALEVGKNISELRDADGKYFIRDRIQDAKSKTSGVQDYHWFNPQQQKLEYKRTYWEKIDNYIFSAGAYAEKAG